MRKIRRSIVFAACALALAAAGGCTGAEKGFDMCGEIGVVSREEGSGTRAAFTELFGIEQNNGDGRKFDNTTQSAVFTNSNSVMLSTVAGDPYAIGYISLGSTDNAVKALRINGAAATPQNVKNGSYRIARPFNIVVREDFSDSASDFIGFILSVDGQRVIEENGYIAVADAGAYTGSPDSGRIVVSGSSSLAFVMEKLKEAYTARNPGVKIELQQSDSSTGIMDAIDGICDIAMVSRELKDSERDKGLNSIIIAMDGIAVIVNRQNSVEELQSGQVRRIFTGELKTWSEVTGE